MSCKMLQVAFSHLDLALTNLREQARHCELGTDDQHIVSEAANMLWQLASQWELHEKSLHNFVHTVRPHAGGLNFEENGELPVPPPEAKQEVNREKERVEQDANSAVNKERTEAERQISTPGNKDASLAILPSEAFEISPSSQDASPSKLSNPVEISDSEVQSRLEWVDMLDIMTTAFRELDTENSLAVPRRSLRDATDDLGLDRRRVKTVFRNVGKTHDGLIYLEEWYSISKAILSLHSTQEIIQMIRNARTRRMGGKSLTKVTPSGMTSRWRRFSRRHSCLISYRSHRRMLWDVFIMVLLMYVALSLPLSFAFGDIDSITTVDQIVDWIFLSDLLMNFRTTFLNEQREEVWDWRAIGSKYLKSWFLLDFFSSFPLEQVTSGIFPRMQPAKLLKFGKIAKASKMLRMSKIAKLLSGSELMYVVEELLWSHNLLSLSRGWMLLLQLLIVAHWLGCLLLACGGDSVDEYLGRDIIELGENIMFKEYVVALYWAIMTMTTVGYGDVLMLTTTERMFAILAMIIGGGFYGYIVGVMSTLLSHRDLDRRAFTERMDIVVSWLNNHYELPVVLRRRVWRNFKELLSTTRAVDDSMILNDLPPHLRDELSEALLHDSVRNHSLFQDLSTRGLSKLVGVLSQVKFKANVEVVSEGDPGKSMFIVDCGLLHLIEDDSTRRLCAGDSFGEDILMREVTEYRYTVRTHSSVTLFKIPRDKFFEHFGEMMDDFTKMMGNFYKCSGCGSVSGSNLSPKSEDAPSTLQAMPGRASLASGGPTGICPSFPDTVLEHFSELRKIPDLILGYISELRMEIKDVSTKLHQERQALISLQRESL